jgi:hypothetical protein
MARRSELTEEQRATFGLADEASASVEKDVVSSTESSTRTKTSKKAK